MIKFVCVILTLIFAMLAFANVQHDMRQLENTIVKNLDICVNKTKVTGVQLDEIGRLHVPKEIPPMCFLACMAKNINIMQDNNEFSKSAIEKLMQPIQATLKEQKMENIGKELMDIINKCADEQSEERDECAVAKTAMACVVTNGKKAGIIE